MVSDPNLKPRLEQVSKSVAKILLSWIGRREIMGDVVKLETFLLHHFVA